MYNDILKIEGLEFNLTCYACPEQYDVYMGGKQVAYVRLRHGRLQVYSPDYPGTLIYSAHPKGDGEFKEDERELYLGIVARVIKNWVG